MKFTLKTVQRINRGGESVSSVNDVFETDNEEIIAVARYLGAKFEDETETEEKVTRKRNVKV